MGTSAKSSAPITWPPINEQGPGTVVRDFEMLLEFIGDKGMKTGGKYYCIPLASLHELDEKMTHPLRPQLERPQQKSFPHLNGLYMLLRASGLGISSGQGSSGRLSLNSDRLAEWSLLNPEEKYFTLLQALHDARWGVIESCHGDYGPWRELWGYSSPFDIRSKSIPKGGIVAAELNLNWHAQTVAGLTELFGLIDIQRVAPKAGENWRIASVRATPFGIAIKSRAKPWLDFAETYDDDDDESDDVDEDEARDGAAENKPTWIGEMFQDVYPNCQKTLSPEQAEFVDGVWQFKVSLYKDVWRRIVIPADLSLEALVPAILKAFKFDDDHMYEFIFRDRSGLDVRVGLSEADCAICTADVAIGCLPLDPGQSMEFEYDFGDEWNFDIKLEEILPPDPRLTKPKLKESVGRAPKQYNYGEDGW